METIADRLKQFRLGEKLSQKEIAKKLGVTNAHISKMEKGKTTPSEALIRLICREYGLNELWLKNGEYPVYSFIKDPLEISTENMLLKSTQQLNDLLRTGNAVIRAQAAQLNVLFSEIINGNYLSDEDKIMYLKLCEKLFYDLNNYLGYLKKYSVGSRAYFEPKDISDVVKDKISDINNDLNKIYEYLCNNNE